jgi:hypothetical protein
MASRELRVPLGASIIRALGLAGSDIPKFILADLEETWDKSAFFSIYTTFTQQPCAAPDKPDAPAPDAESGGTDSLTCCKFEALSTSPEEKSNVSIKVDVDGYGKLEISGSGSIKPEIVPPGPIKPEGNCPGRCQGESVTVIVQLVYHFKLHFALQVLGQGLKTVSSPFKLPAQAKVTHKDSTSAAIDIEFDWEGDAHDSIAAFADCAIIVTNTKEKRPWLESLPGSAGGVVYPPVPVSSLPLTPTPDCMVDVTGSLLGFTTASRFPPARP